MTRMTLEEASEFVTDGTHGSPKRTEDTNGIPLLSAKNVFDGEVRWDDFDRVPTSELDDFQKRVRPRKGDVLMTCVGTIGRTAVWLNERPVVFFRSVAIIRPKEFLMPQYLEYIIRSSDFQNELRRRTKRSSQSGVYLKDIKAVPISVPPLAEQKRIVKLLDGADELRKLRAQSDTRTAALLPALFNEMFGDPIANSRSWQTNELRQLGRVVTGSTPPSAKEEMFGGEIPFITPGDLEKNTCETMRHVTDAGAAEVRTVRAGSTMVCCIGATIGKTDRTWKISAFNQQINAVEWGNEIEDDFGVVCMKQCASVVIGGGSQTALPILKKSLFEQIRIPVPPLLLQKEFAQRVREIREMEAAQASSRQRLEALFQSLLHRAFNGEL